MSTAPQTNDSALPASAFEGAPEGVSEGSKPGPPATRPKPADAEQELSSNLLLEIKKLMIESLNLEGRTPEELNDDAPLFGEPGVSLGLDSLDALELAMALEERFGVQLPEGDAARAHFYSVTTLARFVIDARGGANL